MYKQVHSIKIMMASLFFVFGVCLKLDVHISSSTCTCIYMLLDMYCQVLNCICRFRTV